MPTPKPGSDKFGIEHEIKDTEGKKPLTDKEVREKAKHYMGKKQ